MQTRFPEGWTLHLIEAERLEDGRVMSVVRVDHGPDSFFATSFFRVDDGLILGIDEYWATVEPPPPWRPTGFMAGSSRFDPRDDPRSFPP